MNGVQCDVTWYETRMMELENKHKTLISDLIEQKQLIQQKLTQRFVSQMLRMSELRLATLKLDCYNSLHRTMEKKPRILVWVQEAK